MSAADDARQSASAADAARRRVRRTSLLAAILVMIATGVLTMNDEPDEAPPEAEPAPTPAVETRDASVALVVPPSPPPPAASAARHTELGGIDPCSTEEDDGPFERPTLNELLQLRVAELNDRMREALAAPDASTELRDGWRLANDPAHGDDALSSLWRAPDHVSDGFDVFVAASVTIAARALHDGTTDRARRIAAAASRAAPDDPLPHVVSALSYERDGSTAPARAELAQAFALAPDEPSIALTLASRLEHDADPVAALAAFDAYLAAYPDDREMARRRARVAVHARAFAGGTRYAQRGITVVGGSDLALPRILHVLGIVTAGLARGATMLGVPRRDELTIFVYDDRSAMQRANCTQEWAGALYNGALETDRETLALADEGDASLAHESFHAAMHPIVPNVPLWLDEGLAQYVSGEEGPAHRHSYELMVREHTWIPFSSMNDAFLEIDDSRDAGLAYHQALAMVEWLVDRRGERGIRDAAAWLRGGGDPSRVLAEAAHGELDGETLLAFVGRRLATMPNEGQAPPQR